MREWLVKRGPRVKISPFTPVFLQILFSCIVKCLPFRSTSCPGSWEENLDPCLHMENEASAEQALSSWSVGGHIPHRDVSASPTPRKSNVERNQHNSLTSARHRLRSEFPASEGRASSRAPGSAGAWSRGWNRLPPSGRAQDPPLPRRIPGFCPTWTAFL